jgi:hypothetical protein
LSSFRLAPLPRQFVANNEANLIGLIALPLTATAAVALRQYAPEIPAIKLGLEAVGALEAPHEIDIGALVCAVLPAWFVAVTRQV